MSENKSNSKFGIYALLAAVIFLLLFLQQCNSNSNLKKEKDLMEQNDKALKDTLSFTETKNGEMQAEISTLVMDKGTLEKANKGLYDEVQNQRGKVAQINRVNAELRSDITVLQGMIAEDIEEPSGSVDAAGNYSKYPINLSHTFKYDTTFSPGTYRRITTSTKLKLTNDSTVLPGATTISEDVFGISFITGLEKRDDHYEIFVRSKYPGFQVTKLEGAIIPQDDLLPPQKKKPWSVGPYVGGSINITREGATSFGGSVGVGVMYSIFRF